MNDNNKTSLPATDVESGIGNESVAKKQAGKVDTRVNIHVKSYRARKHDPDGISAKAVIDGLVGFGLLPNDSTEEVKKVSYESFISKEEKTEIIITEVEND